MYEVLDEKEGKAAGAMLDEQAADEADGMLDDSDEEK